MNNKPERSPYASFSPKSISAINQTKKTDKPQNQIRGGDLRAKEGGALWKQKI